MKRNLLIAAGAVALLLLLILGLLFVRPRMAAAIQSELPERTAAVERGDLEVWVTGTGKIQPAAQAVLSFRVSGNVGGIRVGVGDVVPAGTVLMELAQASLDPSLIGARADLIAAQQALQTLLESPTGQQIAQAQLAVALAADALEDAEYTWRVQQQGYRASQSTIDAAEARLLLAERELDVAEGKYNDLSGRPSDDPLRAIALTELEAARQARDAALRALNWYTGQPTEIQQAILDAQVAAAEADLLEARETLEELLAGPDAEEVAAAQARVAAAQAVVDQARLIAPFEGTVMTLGYNPGDSVVPGQTGAVLADLSRLHIDTTVDELDIASVDLGQPVEITLDALPDQVLWGEVARIDLAPVTGTTSTEFPVVVRLESIGDQVRVGMTAALSIQVALKEGVLLVPNWALRLEPGSQDIFVRVLGPGGVVQPVRVTLGLRSDSYSEVLSGLTEGQIVGVPVTPDQPQSEGPFFVGGG
jgi:HlyD family secretion protein